MIGNGSTGNSGCQRANGSFLRRCVVVCSEEYARSAVETIEGIRAIKKRLPGVWTTLGVSNVSFGGGVGDLPTETVTLGYGKVTYNYIPQKTADGTADGVQPVSHDLMKQEVA